MIFFEKVIDFYYRHFSKAEGEHNVNNRISLHVKIKSSHRLILMIDNTVDHQPITITNHRYPPEQFNAI